MRAVTRACLSLCRLRPSIHGISNALGVRCRVGGRIACASATAPGTPDNLAVRVAVVDTVIDEAPVGGVLTRGARGLRQGLLIVTFSSSAC
jgi:hypothetical protein